MKHLLPVIHAANRQQVLDNAEIVFDAGCDGLFLVNHAISHEILIECWQELHVKYSYRYIGINSLGQDDLSIYKDCSELQMLWMDNIYIDDDLEKSKLIFEQKAEFLPKTYLFGGVGFKYQTQPKDLRASVRTANSFIGCDVITTSGPGTGEAATVDKIKTIYNELQNIDSPTKSSIGLASGVDKYNISSFLPFVDYFLVATGISKSWNYLDYDKVVDLERRIREYENKSN